MSDDTVGTADALAIVHTLPKSILRAAVKGRHYPSPPSRQGVETRWDVDALTVLKFFSVMRDSGMKVPLAGALAQQLVKAMREDRTAEEFGVFVIRRPKRSAEMIITNRPPAEATRIFTIPIEAWRSAIRADLRQHRRPQ